MILHSSKIVRPTYLEGNSTSVDVGNRLTMCSLQISLGGTNTVKSQTKKHAPNDQSQQFPCPKVTQVHDTLSRVAFFDLRPVAGLSDGPELQAGEAGLWVRHGISITSSNWSTKLEGCGLGVAEVRRGANGRGEARSQRQRRSVETSAPSNGPRHRAQSTPPPQNPLLEFKVSSAVNTRSPHCSKEMGWRSAEETTFKHPASVAAPSRQTTFRCIWTLFFFLLRFPGRSSQWVLH